jgi:hypothetical protein
VMLMGAVALAGEEGKATAWRASRGGQSSKAKSVTAAAVPQWGGFRYTAVVRALQREQYAPFPFSERRRKEPVPSRL